MKERIKKQVIFWLCAAGLFVIFFAIVESASAFTVKSKSVLVVMKEDGVGYKTKTNISTAEQLVFDRNPNAFGNYVAGLEESGNAVFFEKGDVAPFADEPGLNLHMSNNGLAYVRIAFPKGIYWVRVSSLKRVSD